jgi:hypothetical protein
LAARPITRNANTSYYASVEKGVGFITCDPRTETPWRTQLRDQLQLLLAVGRTNVVVMLDTLPAIDADAIEFLVRFRERILSVSGECTYVALNEVTIAKLHKLAPIAALRVIERVVDLPPWRGAA